MATKINGVELWRGLSPFDGSAIVAIAILHSDNEKTGDMVQIYILPQDTAPHHAPRLGLRGGTCGDCPMGSHNLCYVKIQQGPCIVWKGWKAGKYPLYNASEHLEMFRGRMIRLGAYGDPAMMPAEVVKPLLAIAKGWAGYTHQWKHFWAQDWRTLVMASVESELSWELAKRKAWRTFRIRRADESLRKGEKMCPASAEGGLRTQCERCGACHGAKTEGRADIAIIVHGRKGLPERFTKLSIAGRF